MATLNKNQYRVEYRCVSRVHVNIPTWILLVCLPGPNAMQSVIAGMKTVAQTSCCTYRMVLIGEGDD